MEKSYEGGCHCGRVRFRALVDLDALSDCNCSMCTKKGIVHAIIAPEKFELLSGRDALTTYTFNTGVAKHTFCKHCGILPFGEGTDPKGVATAAINIRCLDNFEFEKVPVHKYDGKSA